MTKEKYDGNGSSMSYRLLEELSLTDFIDKDELQELQDAFARANKIATTIADVQGRPITRPSNHCRVCTLIRETAKGYANCLHSGSVLGMLSLERNEPNYHKCRSVGFFDACAPIVIEGIHIANWLIGQNCTADVDAARILSYADEIGADREEMLQAFREMESISEEEFKEKLEFLWIMANQLSRLAYHNLRYKSLVESLKKAKEELEEYQSNLELLVQKRTAELKRLSGLLPICAYCKRVRDDSGSWRQLEKYIREHSEADFSHGICEECFRKNYPEST